MITLQCRLEFESKEDREKVLYLMRKFSSAVRYSYRRLLEGKEGKEIKKEVAELFGINTRYAGDAVFRAKSVISSCKERGQDPGKVIFGGRKLFQRLRSVHVSGKKREEYRRKWQEKRKGKLYSRGDKSKKGNLNLRFERTGNNTCLRVTVGKREYVHARVVRSVRLKRENDRWTDFVWRLAQAEATGSWFPYSVELKLKDGKVYAFASYEEVLPPVSIARDCGAIGIDLNASPLHIAWAEVGGDGNLMEYGRIDLHELIGKNRNQRENLLWEIAHRIVEIAKEKGKAIAFEDLRKLPGGTRGDGKARLRRRLGQFVYKSLLQKIEVLAGREGIEVVKASPAYTSVIGTLKYCPNHLIDKDIAGAYVVGRRALGLKERVPRNYAGLLSDREYLLCSLQRLIEEREDLKGRLKDERNEYKRRAIRGEIIKLNRDIKLLEEHLQSLEGESGTQHPVNQRKEQVRGSSHEGQKAWRVLRVALAIPLLGKSFARDFSPLRPVLVSGDWKRVAKRPVPAPGAGTTAHLQKCAVQVTRVEHGNGSARRRVSAYR